MPFRPPAHIEHETCTLVFDQARKALGQGTLGIVYKASCVGEHVSACAVKFAPLTSRDEASNFLGELLCLRALSSVPGSDKHVACPLLSTSIVHAGTQLWGLFAMPLGIDATSYVNKRLVNESPTLRAIVGARITAAVARNLAFVHEHGFMHADVKPSNAIIVSECPMETRLVDWNLSCTTRSMTTRDVSRLYTETLEALGASKRRRGKEDDVYEHVRHHNARELREALECVSMSAQRKYITEPYAFFPLRDLADIMVSRVMAMPDIAADEWSTVFAQFRDIYSLGIFYLLVITSTPERERLYDDALQHENRRNPDSTALRAFVAEQCDDDCHVRLPRACVLDVLSANEACLERPRDLLARAMRALDACGALTTSLEK